MMLSEVPIADLRLGMEVLSADGSRKGWVSSISLFGNEKPRFYNGKNPLNYDNEEIWITVLWEDDPSKEYDYSVNELMGFSKVKVIQWKLLIFFYP